MNGALRTLKRQKNLMIGGAVTLVIVLMALFAPLLAPYDPITQADLLHPRSLPAGRSSSGPTRRDGTSSRG